MKFYSAKQFDVPTGSENQTKEFQKLLIENLRDVVGLKSSQNVINWISVLVERSVLFIQLKHSLESFVIIGKVIENLNENKLWHKNIYRNRITQSYHLLNLSMHSKNPILKIARENLMSSFLFKNLIWRAQNNRSLLKMKLKLRLQKIDAKRQGVSEN